MMKTLRVARVVSEPPSMTFNAGVRWTKRREIKKDGDGMKVGERGYIEMRDGDWMHGGMSLGK